MQNAQAVNPLRFLFAKTWQHSEGRRKNIVSYWVMFIVANTITLIFPPIIIAKILDMTGKQGVAHTNINLYLLLIWAILLADMVFWSLHGPARIIERMNAFDTRAAYSKYLIRGMLGLPMNWHSEHHTGNTIDKINKGASGIFNFSEDSFEVIAPCVQITVSYIMIARFSWLAAGMVLAMILLILWIIIHFDRILIGQYRELNKMENDIGESIQDAINNISTILVLHNEKSEFAAIAKKIDAPRELYAKNNVLNEKKWCITSLLGKVMIGLVVSSYYLLHLGVASGVLLASAVLLFRYLEKIQDIFFQFAARYSDMVKYSTRIGNAEELAADFRPESLTNHVLPPHWQSLEIRDLHFEYPVEASQFNLDVSLSFKRGGRYALIGATGSGKSTLLHIMGGHYEPQIMTLLVDGVPIPEKFPGVCRAMTYGLQQFAAFTTTIRQNITMGADNDDEEIRRATDMACFTDVVASLPHGLMSSIKERGVNLSGGQQQRLALSRALLAGSDKDIILLDEPFSALDVLHADRVRENIFREYAGKTIIMTTHDVAHLQSFDRIYLFSHGKITAEGTFDELLASSSEFQELWQKCREHESAATEAVGQ